MTSNHRLKNSKKNSMSMCLKSTIYRPRKYEWETKYREFATTDWERTICWNQIQKISRDFKTDD